jgi:CRISPR-associated endonuclease/helicase Cas3
MRIVGISHDLGKGTVFFQEYLYGRKQDPFLKSHSTSSSLYCYRACKTALKSDDFLPFLALLLVQGHHGGIPSPSTAITRVHSHRNELEKQFASIRCPSELDAMLSSAELPNFNSGQTVLSAVELYKIKKAFDASVRKSSSIRPYYQANMLFSALIDADRMDAAGISIPSRTPINHRAISDFVAKIEAENKEKLGKQSEIIKLRALVRKSVMDKINTTNKIFSLTAPTGSGKTLTALLFASTLRQKMYDELERSPRIIYVLPFLSIIDQNADVISKALGLELGSQSPILITHHHLAKTIYESESSESYSNSVSQLLIEGWNSEVVITTFVQFLEALIGTRASSLRKLHNIAGSIIILDEVQSLDYKHWSLVHDCLEFLANELDTRIILMTATQPLIFRKGEVLELCDMPHGFPDRVRLEVDLNDKSLEQFIARLDEILQANADKNVLIIMNTIDSAIAVFEEISSAKREDKFFLSSGVVPFQRRQRIKEISNRLNKEKKRTVLVSTQVVEAGVDFDFDIVVRDLAPVDSLVQAAGRCNRNGRKPASNSPIFVPTNAPAFEYVIVSHVILPPAKLPVGAVFAVRLPLCLRWPFLASHLAGVGKDIY